MTTYRCLIQVETLHLMYVDVDAPNHIAATEIAMKKYGKVVSVVVKSSV